MHKDFTLLLLTQHYPYSQQFQVLSHDDFLIGADVAGFLKTTEQQVNKRVLDSVYAYASAAVQR
jgi:hypothetical protein